MSPSEFLSLREQVKQVLPGIVEEIAQGGNPGTLEYLRHQQEVLETVLISSCREPKEKLFREAQDIVIERFLGMLSEPLDGSGDEPEPEPPARKKYDPYAIRRCVRKDEILPGGIITFKAKSFTRNDGTEHRPAIDTQTGEMTCTCLHFRFRHRKCKHISRAIANLQRHEKSVSRPKPTLAEIASDGDL